MRMLAVVGVVLAVALATPPRAAAEYLEEKLRAFLDPTHAGPRPTSGILCKLPGNRTAGDTPAARRFADRKAFLAAAYPEPVDGRTPWHGTTRAHELHVVGGIVPAYKPEVAAFLDADVPEVEANLAGAVRLFDWFVDETPKRGTQPSDKRASRIQDVFTEVIGVPGIDSVYCNQATSLFRTCLARRGITSRTVCVFADTDYGKVGGHTFLEVWDPARGIWLFFDPKFGFYSESLSAADVLHDTSHLAAYVGLPKLPLVHHDAGKTKPHPVGRSGAPLWYIENGETGERLECVADE
jgi:hypothetical protein